MNRILWTLSLVVVFTVASFFWGNHVQSHTRQLIVMVEQAEQALEKNQDFIQCEALMRVFEEKWQHVHDTWETMIAHDKLIDIESAFMQARYAIENRDRTEAMLQLTVLWVALKHLADSQVLSLGNLL